ncbi:carboxypeptidase M32 [Anthocerotibacter panamensis]|uniref:carboxypeptidase M32 n=1 Tax=Anthocerotibacter panamensis TaxID=2857077 RepID=UPI001C404278|nr:carboxypeptidase M32 [Anthocerotibacter panamensis]
MTNTLTRTEPKLLELKARLTEINDLDSANALLSWDQSTYMPPGGATARARQMATLRQLSHQKFTDPSLGKLLEDLEPYAESLPYDSDEASLIRLTRREYKEALRIPAHFMAQLSNHTATTYEVWTRARPTNDFAMVAPYLEKSLDLSRQLAEFTPDYENIADPLINMADFGMKATQIRALFSELREHLLPIVQAATSQPPAEDSCLHQSFPEAAQLKFGLMVIRCFGYDFERGRQDKTHHPFMTKFSLGDVRITTRVREYDLTEAVFSTLHESGHALYEQGIPMAFEGTPLASGTSSGVHESQSRLWENLVGRSRGFWNHFYPKLQEYFPNQLGQVSLDTFYRAINKVQRSFIRTDADELTYNLHVMLRFELEMDLLEGRLSVQDLPAAWNERFTASLGITPPNDADGCLQDVHWFGGIIGGAFQGYTIGNILSAQFFDAAVQAHPTIPNDLEEGNFTLLRNWLKTHVHRHGRKFTAPELIERATGQPLTIQPYLAYIRRKYGELYTL